MPALPGPGQGSAQGPLARQALGAGSAGQCNELLQVFRIVNVDCNSWQTQHDAGFARGLRGGVMRLEAVIAKAKRE
jgi:hypothetical protein